MIYLEPVDPSKKELWIGLLALLAALASIASPVQAQTTPAVTVSFGETSHSVEEGGSAEIAVTLSADPQRQVVVPLSVTNQGGATADDYSGVPESMTFESGETSASFTISATRDTVAGEGESVAIGFGTTLPAGVSAGSTATTTVTITDDTTPPTLVSAVTTHNGIKVLVAFSEDITVIPLVATLASQYGISTGMIVRVMFDVTVDSKQNPVMSSSHSGSVLTLRLQSPHARSHHAVTVRYDNIFTEEPGDVVTDLAGNPLATFGEQTVTNASVDRTAWNYVDPPVLDKSKMYLCAGDSGAFRVKLASEPSGDVSVDIFSAPWNVVGTTPDSLTFTTDNWNTYQGVTVLTEDDVHDLMPDGVTSLWGAAAARPVGVDAQLFYDNMVRILIRNPTHADCSDN